jgi:hypothetical protein
VDAEGRMMSGTFEDALKQAIEKRKQQQQKQQPNQ